MRVSPKLMNRKLRSKLREKLSIEKILKKNKLQRIFNSLMIAAIIIFLLFTVISYRMVDYSQRNENKIYEDGYLASNYANKINENALNIRIYSLVYSVTYDQFIADKLRAYGKDINDNINNYKLLHNLTGEEQGILDKLISSNIIYSNKVKQMIDDINKSKTIKNNEIQEIISLDNETIVLSKQLMDYANKYINTLNNQNKDAKGMVISTVIIIDFAMIFIVISIMLIVRKINDEANYYAYYSPVTGLPNKKYVYDTVVNDISKLDKDNYAVLISLDVDNFKAVNDTLGHSAGDKFLKQVGKRFTKIIAAEDYVCHVGGDEFLFLIKSINNKHEAEILINKILNVFKETFYIKRNKIDYVTASLGIVVIDKRYDFEILHNYADDAMYASKREGKDRYSFYDQNMNSNVYEKAVKKKEIEEGIKNGEFKVFYQPKISNEEKFLGAEALVRWIKTDSTIIPPSEFIEFAENEGLIKNIGEVVIIEVCKKVNEWIKKGYRNFRIAINLSAEQLINETSCEKALDIIKEFKIPFEYIEFEVTESTIIKDFNIAIKNIEKIKSYGIKVSLDDFGTGYSSLNYLKELSIDCVKIDKSFIDNLVFDDGSNVMVNTIIKLCHYFGYEVVAEGVEKREQIECLKDLNCDVFQGYYFGKPMNDINFENEFLLCV
ncbi:EAL domain-containing protein [Clostridium sp.]|uniref:EAL domain-containing protein n=1 Tax=Clostridium sp. TaxID=1506 RepID=UPI0026276B7C|nr:EAL domain-containing protein [Clostridium sp.]